MRHVRGAFPVAVGGGAKKKSTHLGGSGFSDDIKRKESKGRKGMRRGTRRYHHPISHLPFPNPPLPAVSLAILSASSRASPNALHVLGQNLCKCCTATRVSPSSYTSRMHPPLTPISVHCTAPCFRDVHASLVYSLHSAGGGFTAEVRACVAGRRRRGRERARGNCKRERGESPCRVFSFRTSRPTATCRPRVGNSPSCTLRTATRRIISYQPRLSPPRTSPSVGTSTPRYKQTDKGKDEGRDGIWEISPSDEK